MTGQGENTSCTMYTAYVSLKDCESSWLIHHNQGSGSSCLILYCLYPASNRKLTTTCFWPFLIVLTFSGRIKQLCLSLSSVATAAPGFQPSRFWIWNPMSGSMDLSFRWESVVEVLLKIIRVTPSRSWFPNLTSQSYIPCSEYYRYSTLLDVSFETTNLAKKIAYQCRHFLNLHKWRDKYLSLYKFIH